jgi:outer membrane protein assembly factor BamB
LKIKKWQISDQTIYGIARGVFIVAASFSLIVCILMLANYLQSKALDPINNQPLETLLKKLEEDAGNVELREQIRAIDLISRKAIFVNQWQLKTGAYLLLGGVIVLLIALKTMDSMQQKLPLPEGVLDEQHSWFASTKARQWIAGLGMFLFGTALIFAMLSYNELSGYDADMPDAESTPEDFLRNWSNFRGPGGNGVAQSENPPVSWNNESGEGIKWKVSVPKPGFNSPIVWEDRVFLSGGDKESLEVYCFDTESGTLLWRKPLNNPDSNSSKGFKPFQDTGYAAPTMTTNGRYVYAIFATGQLACFDFSGNQIWIQDLGIPDNHYGHSSSLLAYENLLIVQYDQSTDARLLALDAVTGNTVWRVNRDIISWSSPICVNTGNQMELIVTNSEFVHSYDPITGVKLWEIKCLSGEHGPSPAFADGMVVVANEYSSATGIRLGEEGAEAVWEYVFELPDASSPLATDKYVFLPTSYGIIACLDAKTGEALWDHKFDNGFYASPILAGNLVYALDFAGIMHIFEADKKFKSIGSYAVGEKSNCTPAIVGDNIYIRTENSLLCIDGN